MNVAGWRILSVAFASLLTEVAVIKGGRVTAPASEAPPSL